MGEKKKKNPLGNCHSPSLAVMPNNIINTGIHSRLIVNVTIVVSLLPVLGCVAHLVSDPLSILDAATSPVAAVPRRKCRESCLECLHVSLTHSTLVCPADA